jgi:hypothetical protein
MFRWMLIAALFSAATGMFAVLLHWIAARSTLGSQLDGIRMHNLIVDEHSKRNFWFREVIPEPHKSERDIVYDYDENGLYDRSSPRNALYNLCVGFLFSFFIICGLIYGGKI